MTPNERTPTEMAYQLPARHQEAADRIPTTVRKGLSDLQLLARLEYRERVLARGLEQNNATDAAVFFRAAGQILSNPHVQLPAAEIQKAAAIIVAANQPATLHKAASEPADPWAALVEPLAAEVRRYQALATNAEDPVLRTGYTTKAAQLEAELGAVQPRADDPPR